MWLVVNFFYVFLLQLIKYYLLLTNPVFDLKKLKNPIRIRVIPCGSREN